MDYRPYQANYKLYNAYYKSHNLDKYFIILYIKLKKINVLYI